MFLKNFLWGAATSSHQVEGNNIHNDWWAWEKEGRLKYLSGEATRHYELFDDDFQLAKQFNHNAHRFSIEWSRIEPKENSYDENGIHHYRQVIASLHKYALKPIVTLHHFTNPRWFAEAGGWLNPRAPFWFVRYVEKIVTALGDKVEFWLTLNEPMVLAYHGYLVGLWPPGERSVKKTWTVVHNLVQAHRLAFRKIYEIYQKNHWSRPQVGLAKEFVVFKVCPLYPTLGSHLGVFLRHRLFNLYFLERVRFFLDFIGVNYYQREFTSNQKLLGYGRLGGRCNKVHGHIEHLNAVGWDSYPLGLGEVLDWLKKYHLPIMITENGTCEDDDQLCFEFIRDHIGEVQNAMKRGINVIGYLYWSLLDNFEWHHGFGPRFGLVAVDYKTFKRTPRQSAYRLAEMIASALEP